MDKEGKVGKVRKGKGTGYIRRSEGKSWEGKYGRGLERNCKLVGNYV
jgi:hypothetical protein